MTETTRPRSRDRELWLRRGCALVVAGVAAYGSYEHQRDFALHGGADPVSDHLAAVRTCRGAPWSRIASFSGIGHRGQLRPHTPVASSMVSAG